MRHPLRPGFMMVIALLLAAAAAPAAEDLHAKIVESYMKSDIEALEEALARAATAELTEAQKADVAYVRSAMAECRPAWWKQVKQSKRTAGRAVMFGKPLLFTYEPTAKDGMSFNIAPGGMTFLYNWPAEEMDSADKGEYGFLKGDQAAVGVWAKLGAGSAIAALNPQAFNNMTEADQMRLQRYMYFRGNLAALCYTTPAARRYALHIYMSAFLDQYGKGPIAGTRRVVGSMLMAEVLADPSKYPSLKLPKSLDADDAEKKLGSHYKFAINRNAVWTIPEDRAYRTALKAFAAANDKAVFETQKVTLPNKLVFSLDDSEDASLKPRRDAWVKEKFDAAKK